MAGGPQGGAWAKASQIMLALFLRDIRLEFTVVRLDVRKNRLQAMLDRREILARQQPHRVQHFGMGDRAKHIVARQPNIERERFDELNRQCVLRGADARLPGFIKRGREGEGGRICEFFRAM